MSVKRNKEIRLIENYEEQLRQKEKELEDLRKNMRILLDKVKKDIQELVCEIQKFKKFSNVEQKEISV